MQKRILLSVFMLLAISIAFGATAETPVIGFIAQDTTWTQANSPYVTMGNIIVKEGVTLTIEPGITVQFDSGHSLTVEGRLIARGTDKQDIKFIPKGERKPGVWGGIVFEDSSTDAKFDDAGNYISGCILQYCTVEFAETAVKGNSASPFIDHSVINNNASRGIYISGGDIVVIQDCTITDNKGGGIFVALSGSVTLTGNTLTGNTTTARTADGGGIYVSGGATISNNTLIGNKAEGESARGGGIHVHPGGMQVTISNNTLIENRAGGFRSSFTLAKGSHLVPLGDSYGGGIYVASGGNLKLNNNTLIENKAIGIPRAIGGGVYVDSYRSTATINNNILCGNMATGDTYVNGNGGGIYVESYHGTAVISDNLLCGNSAKSGGGISVGGVVAITDNIITENSGLDGVAIDCSGEDIKISGNFVADNVAEGSGNTNAVDIGNSGILFTGNTIIGNQTTYNLYYSLLKGAPNLNATNNYWGVTTEAEIRVKIYDVFADSSKAVVDVTPFLTENPSPIGSLTIVASPQELPADDTSTATITATLNDPKGNSVVDKPLTMVISQGTGRLSEVKNNKDGTYTAMYTASREEGTEAIWVIAPKQRLAQSVEIKLIKPK